MKETQKTSAKIDPAYQRHLQKVAEEVKSSPKWKQGGIGVANPPVLKMYASSSR